MLECLELHHVKTDDGTREIYRDNVVLIMMKEKEAWLQELRFCATTKHAPVVPILSAGYCNQISRPDLGTLEDTYPNLKCRGEDVICTREREHLKEDKIKMTRLASAYPFVICRPRVECTLAEILVKEQRSTSSLQSIAHMLHQIAVAIESVHTRCGVAHRNITPLNIVRMFRLGTLEMLLTTPPTYGTTETQIQASSAYVPPECIKHPEKFDNSIDNAEEMGKKIDLWSFGVIMYEMLAGTPLFAHVNGSATAGSVEQIRTWVGLQERCNLIRTKWNTASQSSDDVIEAAIRLLQVVLHKDQSKRPLTMAAILGDDFFTLVQQKAWLAITIAVRSGSSNHSGTGMIKISYYRAQSWFVILKLALALAPTANNLQLYCIDDAKARTTLSNTRNGANTLVNSNDEDRDVDVHVVVVSPEYVNKHPVAPDATTASPNAKTIAVPYGLEEQHRGVLQRFTNFSVETQKSELWDAAMDFSRPAEFREHFTTRLKPTVEKLLQNARMGRPLGGGDPGEAPRHPPTGSTGSFMPLLPPGQRHSMSPTGSAGTDTTNVFTFDTPSVSSPNQRRWMSTAGASGSGIPRQPSGTARGSGSPTAQSPAWLPGSPLPLMAIKHIRQDYQHARADSSPPSSPRQTQV